MEVCVVPEREELPKGRSYGEGGVGILSFHMEGSDDDDQDDDHQHKNHHEDDSTNHNDEEKEVSHTTVRLIVLLSNDLTSLLQIFCVLQPPF